MLGSFPYHSASSVCLAAIHAGVISDEAGGGVWVNRFYRHDWSNTSTQTIFPYQSWRGSLSNGVQSEEVDHSWYSVPSNASEWSYTVRGRGDHIVQRRQAPFAARAGHLQFVSYHVYEQFVDAPLVAVHLIIGGYNATHYLNDVWAGVQHTNGSGHHMDSDITWIHLEDAPFSPRADMMLMPAPQTRSHSLRFGYSSFLILGGQTHHLCSLRELGVCSGEMWMLVVSVTALGRTPTVELTWTYEPSLAVTFPTRCQAAALYTGFPTDGVFPRRVNGTARESITLFGGQLSYNDSTCSSPPVTVNEVWSIMSSCISPGGFVNYSDTCSDSRRWFNWSQLNDALFSPRRFETHNYHTFLETGGELAGGINHLAIAPAVFGSRARLVSSEVSAELWHLLPNSSTGEYNFRLSSLAAPTAADVSQASIVSRLSGGDGNSFAFGGVTPASFIRQWQLTPPILEANVDTDFSELGINITMMKDSYRGSESSRQGLPLRVQLDEVELKIQTATMCGAASGCNLEQEIRWTARHTDRPFITNRSLSSIIQTTPAGLYHRRPHL